MSIHETIHENLDAYLAGGLTPAERKDIEAHIEICAECAQTVKESRQLEQTMNEVFAKDRPDAALEERAIAKLRKTRIKRATALRFIGAAAAVLVFGLLGAALQAVAFGHAMAPRPRMATDVADSRSLTESTIKHGRNVGESTFAVVDVDPSMFESNTDIEYKAERIGEVGVPGSVNGLREGGGTGESNKFSLGRGSMAGLSSAGTLAPESKGASGSGGENGKIASRVQFAPVFVSPNMDWAEENRQLGFSLKLLADHKEGRLGGEVDEKKSAKPDGERNSGLLADLKLRGTDYFKLSEPGKSAAAQTPPAVGKPAPPGDGPPEKKPPEGEKDKKEAASPKEPSLPEPEPTDRKIIRTGDIEFEIDAFDKAAATVKRLIGAVKGGFISNNDSKRLQNGKMRGFIVVRMPPEHLDRFILDLRAELTKVGSLRSERVGSQDVTKQYADSEGELKAARVVADGLLAIMKNPKAEVKDLIAAERELGNWRTKIEKMEGEIRYYKNQIALSTLTITLYEKEILAAFALIVTDHVKMRIEVEHVTEAHKAALKALADVNGRITKSELRQHKAGQLEAILFAEVPPNKKDAFRDQIKKLGIVSEHDETQRQQAEGGTGKAPGLKPQINDVQFEVALNNIVNIPPRHSVTLQVATEDVQANYAKLQDAILRIAKGQIRDAKISEKDKQNVTAVIDFNVPIDQKAALDKLIGEIGPVLTKSASQVAVTELATDRKFGYLLNLSSVANVPPRETIGLKIEVKDVDKTTEELKKLVDAGKGRVVDASVARQENGQVNAALVFEVPLNRSELLVMSIKKEGNLLSQKTERDPAVPENELATARIIVILNGVFAGKEPREKIALKIEVQKVEEKMADLKEKVKAAKGKVLDEKSGRQSNGQAGAKLVFEVPLAAEDGLVAQFKESGNLVSYDTQRNAQVPDNDLASAQITVVLAGVSPIVPEDESYFRKSLSLSFTVFATCLLAILVGLSAAVPIGAVLFVMYWLIRKIWPSKPTPA
jgi:Domain of unknown function (DUF4349)/Putative zinc-finger